MSKHHHHREGAFLDWLGLGLSSLCAVHCLALPFFLTLLPLAWVGHDNYTFHFLMVVVLIPLGLVAFWRGYKRHRMTTILAMGASGLLFITSGLMAQPGHESEHFANFSLPISLTVLGSFLLITAHYLNWSHSRCKTCKATPPHQL